MKNNIMITLITALTLMACGDEKGQAGDSCTTDDDCPHLGDPLQSGYSRECRDGGCFEKLEPRDMCEGGGREWGFCSNGEPKDSACVEMA